MGEDHHELLKYELVQAQAVALHPLGHRQERQVEHVVAQHLGHFLARLLPNRELDPRMALMEDGQGQRNVNGAHRVHGADHHVPAAHPGERLHLGGRGVDLGQDPPRAGHQRPPCLGHRHPPRGPLDQGQTDLLLEPVDLLGERRLGDVRARRGSREMPLVGEGDEVAQLT